MRKEKKILVLTMISLMAVYCLCGCGFNDDVDDTTDGSTSANQGTTDDIGEDDLGDDIKDVADDVEDGVLKKKVKNGENCILKVLKKERMIVDKTLNKCI